MNNTIKDLAIKAGLDITLLSDYEKVEYFAKLVADKCTEICRQRLFTRVEDDYQTSHNNALFCAASDIDYEFYS